MTTTKIPIDHIIQSDEIQVRNKLSDPTVGALRRFPGLHAPRDRLPGQRPPLRRQVRRSRDLETSQDEHDDQPYFILTDGYHRLALTVWATSSATARGSPVWRSTPTWSGEPGRRRRRARALSNLSSGLALTDNERADAILKISDLNPKAKQSDIAKRIGVGGGYVSRLIRGRELRGTPGTDGYIGRDKVNDAVVSEIVSADEEIAYDILKAAAENKWSVSKARRAVKATKSQPEQKDIGDLEKSREEAADALSVAQQKLEESSREGRRGRGSDQGRREGGREGQEGGPGRHEVPRRGLHQAAVRLGRSRGARPRRRGPGFRLQVRRCPLPRRPAEGGGRAGPQAVPATAR